MLTYKVLETTCGIVVSHINNSAVITHVRKIGQLGVPGGNLCSSRCNILQIYYLFSHYHTSFVSNQADTMFVLFTYVCDKDVFCIGPHAYSVT